MKTAIRVGGPTTGGRDQFEAMLQLATVMVCECTNRPWYPSTGSASCTSASSMNGMILLSAQSQKPVTRPTSQKLAVVPIT